MKKKAILMPEVIKIVVAIAVIIILITLMVKLYGLFERSSATKQAEQHLDKISEIVNRLEDGETYTYFLHSPSDWILITSPYEKDNRIIDKCKRENWENCICLCPKGNGCTSGLSFSSSQVESCKTSGVCRELNKEPLIFPTSYLKDMSYTTAPICINNLIPKFKQGKGKNVEFIAENNKLIIKPENYD